jgi:hypothetical protein
MVLDVLAAGQRHREDNDGHGRVVFDVDQNRGWLRLTLLWCPEDGLAGGGDVGVLGRRRAGNEEAGGGEDGE